MRGGPNPVPVKAALAIMGLLPSDAVRRPLLPLDEPDRARLVAVMSEVGLVDAGGRFSPAATNPGTRAGSSVRDAAPGVVA